MDLQDRFDEYNIRISWCDFADGKWRGPGHFAIEDMGGLFEDSVADVQGLRDYIGGFDRAMERLAQSTKS